MTNQKRENLGGRGATGVILSGGLPKRRYYAPDGEEVFAIPSMREFQAKNAAGKVIRSGTRDANLDKGWTTTPPSTLKIKCACKKYHDTQDEVDFCVAKRGASAAKWERTATTGDEQPQIEPSERVDAMQAQLDEMKAQLQEVLGGK
jgi:hypothetical protein